MAHIWVFGYGSLIWRPDLEYLERRPARITGWTRRFWQGSHDHRGTPDAPGRVVTLVPEAGACCDGVAYLIDADTADAIFAGLDHREKNGYERHRVRLEFPAPPARNDDGVVYIASRRNHAFLGPAPTPEIAAQILGSHGPSGSNIEYLLELAAALRGLGVEDEHVFELERAVRAAASC